MDDPAHVPTIHDVDDFGFRFQAMACDCEVRIAGMDRRTAEPLAQRAIAEVRRIEAKYSRYRVDSELSRINASAGSGRTVIVDPETAHLLVFADRLHTQSDGLFDITSGVLRRAWDFRARRKPSADELQALLPFVGWNKVLWHDDRIALPQQGMELDFGGFGKEYAADRAATLLQAAGVNHGMVNLGGDLRVMGPRPDGRPWIIGIQHPREPRKLMAHIAVAQGALATSGDYERSFDDVDGNRLCHVLDPRTGWPVSAWRSVSVVAPACLAAGALTTMAMLKQVRAVELLQQQGVSYLAMDAAGAIHQRGAIRGEQAVEDEGR